MSFAATIAAANYHEGIAEELESIAKAVSRNPMLSQHFAERLNELAKQLRQDTRLIRLTPH